MSKSFGGENEEKIKVKPCLIFIESIDNLKIEKQKTLTDIFSFIAQN